MAGNAIADIFKIRELRNKVFYALALLVVFRIGAVVPIPGINVSAIQAHIEASRSAGGSGMGFADYLDFFSGGAFSNYSILMLGIMPYISAQIIMQVLMLVFPNIKKMLEEDGGKRKFQKLTRYGAVGVCLIQGFAAARGALAIEGAIVEGLSTPAFMMIALVSITAGSLFLIWLGEQITQKGIGNGVSLIIFAGIVARIPSAMAQLALDISMGSINAVFVLVAVLMFVGVVVLVIFEQQGERKIPVNYAKRIVGRQMMQAQNSYIPFKINPSGVIPIIFASSILTFPIQILEPLAYQNEMLARALTALRYDGPLYNVLYALMIVAFAYFYTQVSLNPIEVARQIRDHGGSIPSVRSEKMEEYLQGILNRIVLPGALFLAVIALLPTFIINKMGLPASVAHLMGGTSLLIIVGVDLDTMSQLESQLKMHQHDGLTARGRIKSRNI